MPRDEAIHGNDFKAEAAKSQGLHHAREEVVHQIHFTTGPAALEEFQGLFVECSDSWRVHFSLPGIPAILFIPLNMGPGRLTMPPFGFNLFPFGKVRAHD
jgi:hypothetical protein